MNKAIEDVKRCILNDASNDSEYCNHAFKHPWHPDIIIDNMVNDHKKILLEHERKEVEEVKAMHQKMEDEVYKTIHSHMVKKSKCLYGEKSILPRYVYVTSDKSFKE